MSKYNYLTKDGYNRIKNELEELKSDGRKKAAQDIAEARAQGDLSENAEYDAAKDAQGMLELKINELEKILANARMIDEDNIDTSKCSILTKVTIRNVANKREATYQLVSESEADLKAKKISISSPMGKGILGKEKGDIAVVVTPGGTIKFEILDITL